MASAELCRAFGEEDRAENRALKLRLNPLEIDGTMRFTVSLSQQDSHWEIESAPYWELSREAS
jgi:hypothetical protein